MLSIVTGFIFTLLLTRNMSKESYGIWSNVFDLVGYFALTSGLFPFWAMRFICRDKEGAVKTGFTANLIVALLSMGIYLVSVPFITGVFGISGIYVVVYFLAAFQILNVYLIGIFEGCLRAIKPQAIGYGLLIEEVCKVILALTLIIGFRSLLIGAIISLIVGTSIQVIYYVRLLSAYLRERVRWSYAREWLKGSTAGFYNAIGNQLAGFTIIFVFVLGGQAARGDYQAAMTFANAVGFSSFLGFALYPKLLSENTLEGVTSSFRTVMMFAVPMVAIMTIMSESLLTVLNVFYGAAWPVLIVLLVDAFVLTIFQFYSSVLFGVEKFDEKAEIPFNSLVRSRIFKVFSLPYLQAAIALPVSFYVLTRLAEGQSLNAVLYVTLINLGVHVLSLFLLFRLVTRVAKLAIPWISLAKYILSAAVTVILLYFLPHPTTILLTLGIAVLGVLIYGGILLSIDRNARKLIHSIGHEIKIILKENVMTKISL